MVLMINNRIKSLWAVLHDLNDIPKEGISVQQKNEMESIVQKGRGFMAALWRHIRQLCIGLEADMEDKAVIYKLFTYKVASSPYVYLSITI